MDRWIFVLVQKGSNVKKENYYVRNLKKIGPSLPLKDPKEKRNQFFLITTIFFFPEARFWEFKVKTTEWYP
jgi:hypothetical protein